MTTDDTTSDASPRDRALARLLDIRRRARAGDQSGWLDDIEFLLDLAMDEYDMPSWTVASNVRELVEGDGHERFLPTAAAPRRREPLGRGPLGPVVSVDEYQCGVDPEVSVEVARVPNAEDIGDPICPVCGRGMTHVRRRLRRTAAAVSQPAVRWSRAARAILTRGR